MSSWTPFRLTDDSAESVGTVVYGSSSAELGTRTGSRPSEASSPLPPGMARELFFLFGGEEVAVGVRGTRTCADCGKDTRSFVL